MNALELAIKEFDDMIETRKNALARGHAKDYAEYQHIAGVITGLATANERLKDLLRYEEEL